MSQRLTREHKNTPPSLNPPHSFDFTQDRQGRGRFLLPFVGECLCEGYFRVNTNGVQGRTDTLWGTVDMTTLRQFSHTPESIPATTSWYLADLGEARGKQELFTKQAPQRLKILREHALIESAVSSNRIEGVTVDQSRIRTVVFGKSHLRDRDEEEVRGYRNALKIIHEQAAKLPVSEDTIRRLHTLTKGKMGDAGQYKQKASDII